MSALVFQTVWMRQFRLVFGGSTAASAAVLAIFMAGLGFGAILLGRRAEKRTDALRMYGQLELAIAFFAALSPGLIEIVRRIYFATGGAGTLGDVPATALRLVLASAVLLVPTLLMGGTLPAAARAVETESDVNRRASAMLYGANTVGAVTGVLITTFYALELYGNRLTLWMACLVNAAAGVAAILASRSSTPRDAAEEVETQVEQKTPMPEIDAVPRPPAWFVRLAAALVGFAFLLMELVWYRMLTPILGGTLFSFGLILACALLGIGIGGIIYGQGSWTRAVTMRALALTCALEALLIALPYALGDRIAVLATLLRSLGAIGFSGYVIGWAAIAMLIVFPAALIAGIQFPLLIGLLGSGRKNVAVDIGQVYAWNTVGAIAGSIAGGFGLLPLLTAPGAWRLVIVVLCLLSVGALLVPPRRLAGSLVTVVAVVLAMAALGSAGPTAAWRHSPIGAGRVDRMPNRNEIMDWLHRQRRILAWEADGTESSVGLTAEEGYAFVVNGKIDGHSRFDAGTQVMSGLVGGILHPDPRHVLIVGLGTGSTAGWLAKVPSVERVDVVELEPAILHVARVCTPVNQNVLGNPKAHVQIGDGREVLVTTRRSYDLIISEPSNPYRAGIASLYTTEFYRAVARKLKPGGLFLQWMQAYEIDSATLRTVYATFGGTFPSVETWQTQGGDLLLIGSFQPMTHDVARLRNRIAQEPYRSALANAWRVTDLEGLFAHYVAGPETAEYLASGGERNTDDRMIVEFAFARTLGASTRLRMNDVKALAKVRSDDFPAVTGEFDKPTVERRRLSMIVAVSDMPFSHPMMSPEVLARGDTHIGYLSGNYANVMAAWTSQPIGPQDPVELLTFAEGLADQANPVAETVASDMRAVQPIEADLVVARLRLRQKRVPEAAALLERAFVAYRTNPWPLRIPAMRGLELATAIASQDPSGQIARRLYAVLQVPFSVALLDQKRLEAMTLLAQLVEPGGRCGELSLAAIRKFEPHVPWRREFLVRRVQCYDQHNDARRDRARMDLKEHDQAEPLPLATAPAR